MHISVHVAECCGAGSVAAGVAVGVAVGVALRGFAVVLTLRVVFIQHL